MKQMAHRHPSLPDPCEVCEDHRPLVSLPYVPEEDGSLMLLVAAAVVLAAIFLGVLWVLFAAFG